MRTKPARQGRRPTQERAKATREHILDTAARLFGERGIADTSTNRIAAEADVSIGTVYRYFADRSVMVDELLERLLVRAEQRCTAWISETTQLSRELTRASASELFTKFLESFTDELADNAKLVRALIDGVQFYSSGLPEFEPRLRLLIKVLLIQILGPGDDRKYDTMTFVLINTGFSAVLRTSAVEVTPEEREAAIAMTGRMMGAWLEAEMDLA
ncbi:TetR/AcrR family transcriptional regulator [Nocardia shimofusensis]|uniref:TetR/AcrR family transcriptional regulator n=1 Tax=Nocardia shimofusensis TaxID=228596 RepID=UPI00082AA9AA|nr:TetR/AcrR family transcriptional regulator [Nocardia shimofusensis]